MIDLKFTKQRFKDHFYYSKWLYVLFILIAITLFSLVFTVTRPVVPREFRVDINILGTSVQDNEISLWEQEILETLSKDQQEVNITALGINSGNESIDYTSYEILTAKMAAKEGDIYILPRAMYESYSSQGAFVALDDIATKYEYSDDIDLKEYETMIEDEDSSDGKAHIYGLPVDNVLGLVDLGFNPTDMVISIMIYTENYDNALKALDYIMNQTESELLNEIEAVDN